MPVRIPAARRTELLSFSIAGIGAFAPFYMLLPGAEERLASQTAKWAPRWERNINYFAAPTERAVQRFTPPVEKTVKRIDQRLPLEKVTKNAHRRIEKGMDRVSKPLMN